MFSLLKKNGRIRPFAFPVRRKLYWKNLRFFFYIRIALLEAFNTARAIDQFLLARIKGVAIIANFNVRAFDRGLCFNDISARTGKSHCVIFGMYFVFHAYSLETVIINLKSLKYT
jgi:hypothetical protein